MLVWFTHTHTRDTHKRVDYKAALSHSIPYCVVAFHYLFDCGCLSFLWHLEGECGVVREAIKMKKRLCPSWHRDRCARFDPRTSLDELVLSEPCDFWPARLWFMTFVNMRFKYSCWKWEVNLVAQFNKIPTINKLWAYLFIFMQKKQICIFFISISVWSSIWSVFRIHTKI